MREPTSRDVIQDAPGKSGALLERLIIDGEPYVLKHLDRAADWTMRASGCLRGAPLELWERGILARVPGCFNQPIVDVYPEARGCAVLMHDVAPWLVPVTDEPISAGQHERFLTHMATLHAAFWGCGDDVDVVPAMHRYLELSPWMAQAEAAIGSDHLVPQLVGKGWQLLADVAPAASAVAGPLAVDPGPLVEALETTPQTFVHSNFKLDNLGTDDLGRTVILDWEQPGRGAALTDLAWYLAINCRRLSYSKEDSIGAYRSALEAQGIGTEPWWDRQLALSLLGALVQFGWEKALGGYDEELRWWETRALEAADLLGLSQALPAAYDAAADDWAAGPGQVYQALARALVAAAAKEVPPVKGRRILDVGAGTGAAGRAAREAGAGQVVSVDAAIGMLRHCEKALHPVAADACALPFGDDSFHLVLAAFSLSHLASIGGGLREIRRVAGALAGSAFAPGWTHPAKALVDDALRPFGYQPPAWYGRLKAETEPAASDPAWIRRQATEAGFRDAATTAVEVATGLSAPAALASWRLGLAHIAPFLAGLSADRKAAAWRAAEHAVAGCQPLTVSMLVLTAR